MGDLPGLTARLDYLAWLGVDALWLSPIFRSPMRDFGYDVADYRDVDPLFGTLADLDALLSAAHRRGLRVVLDYVPNHTSSDHPWFREARATPASARRDWYVWRDPGPAEGSPNSLRATFGGPAWTLDETSGQYWFHTFLPEQPELDWRNPAVRAEMLDVLRFWFARGIDGVRIDVLWLLAKDGAPWRDDPINAGPGGFGDPGRAIEHGDGPETPARLRELRAVADEFPDRVLIGEVYARPPALMRFYGEDGAGVHLPFNFALVTLAWDAESVVGAISEYERALPEGAWPNWVLGNHDQSRIASRVGRRRARVAAMLLLTLRGTPTLYYGDELGLEDVPVPPERVVDPGGRDPQRSPMPWDRGRNGGFTTGDPWLPLALDAGDRSVEAQRDDARSPLSLHRALLALRRSEPALSVGSWASVDAPAGVAGYERSDGATVLRVLLNLGASGVPVPVNGAWTVLLSTGLDREGERVRERVVLRGDEGLVLGPVTRMRRP